MRYYDTASKNQLIHLPQWHVFGFDNDMWLRIEEPVGAAKVRAFAFFPSRQRARVARCMDERTAQCRRFEEHENDGND